MGIDLGQHAMSSILKSPEATQLEILNVSEITYEDGSHSEDVTTSTTNGIFQDRTESDIFHRAGQKTEIDAVAYLDTSASIELEDELKKSSSDISFQVEDIEERSGYKRVELKEVV